MNAQSSSKADILIVDDTVENLRLLTDVLKEQGYNARPVPSGKLALQAAQNAPPDLILLDINMPDLNGYETCRQLKAEDRLKEIPVIFIGALSETIDKVKAFGVGGVDYIPKPFEFAEVLVRVQTHLALRRLHLDVKAKNQSLIESLNRQQELEQVRDQLVQMIVHDLKNPLSAIMGNSYFLLEQITEGSDVGDAIGDVAEAAQRMHRMVLNILDVMHLEQKEIEVCRTSVDLNRLVESAVSVIRPFAHKSHRSVQVRGSQDLPKIPLDRDLMQRVLENLLDNSLKYSPAGTPVTVEIGISSEGEVAIDVCDQGPGIPIKKRTEVFDMYARLDREKQGSASSNRGIGLAFCKMAVDAHGGKIWIDDNQPCGAVFRIRIPSTPSLASDSQEGENGGDE